MKYAAWAWAALLVVGVVACGDDDDGSGDTDAGRPDAARVDAGRDADAGREPDADEADDAGDEPVDASRDASTDAHTDEDASTNDDAGANDDAGPDPCEGIPETDRCDVEGMGCDGAELTVCAPNAAGCIVATITDCSTMMAMTCGRTAGGGLACIPPPCGNGTLDEREACDDGDVLPDDGCSASCTVEPGFVCMGTPSVCVTSTDNGACSGAVALTGTIGGDVTGGGARPTGALCGSGTGPARYYSVIVPARTQMHVTATPSTAWDATLHALVDCAAAGCSTFSDTGGTTAGTERITITNDTDAPMTRIVAVAAATTSGGSFALTATTNGIPFTAIAASCESPPGLVTTHFGSGADDLVTPLAPLPFSVALLGEVETRFSVSTNGILQLAPATTSGSIEPTGANVTIPTGPFPNSMVAVLWDDLIVNAAGSIRSWTAGAAPMRKLVVEWSDVGFSGLPGASLRMQAQLYETTGVIELHYCELGGTFLVVRGSGATIGLEDATGTTGRLVSFNTRDAITAGGAFRFSP